MSEIIWCDNDTGLPAASDDLVPSYSRPRALWSYQHALTVYQPFPPLISSNTSVSQPFSSNGVAVAQNSVLLSLNDITPYTFFGIENDSGFSLTFQISLGGVTFYTVSMVDSVALTGDTVTAIVLATGKLWTRGIKGVSAQILAGTAGSNIYASSVIQLSAGVGAP